MMISDWLEGARLRTLPAAIAPVLAGIGAAIAWGGFSFIRSLLALLVALALQVGVNFANDYSDGIRGTDKVRIGPVRLTASGKVAPKKVLFIALSCFAFASAAGLILVIISGTWWLILAGIAAILAAWFYTGGKHPYGYYGLAEGFVIVFFGFMATVGTAYTQLLSTPWQVWIIGMGLGLLSCALLMANNVRDIPTDRKVGKYTLAVRLGERSSRGIFCVYFLAAFICLAAIANSWIVWAVLFIWSIIAGNTCLPMLKGAKGGDLLLVLRNTGLLTLGYGVIAALAFNYCVG